MCRKNLRYLIFRISLFSSSCRFCLKFFEDDARGIAITNLIRNQFYEITRTALNESEVYSQFICELCYKLVDDWTSFKAKLTRNQQRLENSLDRIPEDGMNEELLSVQLLKAESFGFDPNGTEIVTVKVECTEWNDNVSTNGDNRTSEDAQDEDRKHLEFMSKEEKFLLSAIINFFNFSDDWSDVAQSQDVVEDESNESQNNLQIKRHKKESSCNKKMCDICGTWFNSMAFKRHYDRIHLQKKDFCCDLCGYKVFKKFDLNNHIKSHLKVRNEGSNLILFNFRSQQIKNHFCHECPAAFTTKTGLRTHLLVHSNNRSHSCDMEGCTAAFKSREALKRHIKSHLRFRKHECSECLRKFADSYKLKRHKQSAHLPADPTQQTPCPFCEKVFKTRDVMKKHLVYHKPPEFRCETCNKEFYMMINLKTHIKSNHGGSKDFQCKYCNSSYFKNCHLNRHILTVHMKQKILCQVAGCQLNFPRKERYKGER